MASDELLTRPRAIYISQFDGIHCVNGLGE